LEVVIVLLFQKISFFSHPPRRRENIYLLFFFFPAKKPRLFAEKNKLKRNITPEGVGHEYFYQNFTIFLLRVHNFA